MKLEENISLKTYNTFGIDVKAKYLILSDSPSETIEAIKFTSQKELEILPLGKGSNILFTSDFNGVVIVQTSKDIDIIEEDNDSVRIKVSAGVPWDDFVKFAVSNNFWGIENLSLIPGTVGASPVQNIGAYGAEVSNVITTVSGIEIYSGEAKTFTNSECLFSYRDSIFKGNLKGKFIITEVEFMLSKKANPIFNYRPLAKIFSNRNEIQLSEIREAIIKIRNEKLPDINKIGNAGSFFKNTVLDLEQFEKLKYEFPTVPFYDLGNNKFKIPSAWLIEIAGLKGYREGSVGVSPTQALVIVNYGNATGEEVLRFSKKIKNLILKKFNISLQTEVNIL